MKRAILLVVLPWLLLVSMGYAKGDSWEVANRKAREATPREPIPEYIVACESGGQLHKPAADGLGGGRYQIIPDTWRAHLPKDRFIWAAGGNDGPVKSSRLLQDKVAWTIYRQQGASQWVCA